MGVKRGLSHQRQNKLKVSENGVLRQILRTKWQETGENYVTTELHGFLFLNK
jgi:hypothetical protein